MILLRLRILIICIVITAADIGEGLHKRPQRLRHILHQRIHFSVIRIHIGKLQTVVQNVRILAIDAITIGKARIRQKRKFLRVIHNLIIIIDGIHDLHNIIVQLYIIIVFNQIHLLRGNLFLFRRRLLSLRLHTRLYLRRLRLCLVRLLFRLFPASG